MIYNYMQDLINYKYYKTKEEVIIRLNAFCKKNIIKKEEYEALVELMNIKYDLSIN